MTVVVPSSPGRTGIGIQLIMALRVSLLLSSLVVLLVLSDDARRLTGEVLSWFYRGFVVLYVDASNFVTGCF